MGVNVTIADAKFETLDVELVDQLMETLVYVDSWRGSMEFGSIVLQHVNKNRSALVFDSIFVADRFIDQADVNSMYEDAGMGINNMLNRSIKLIEQSSQNLKEFDFGNFQENAVS